MPMEMIDDFPAELAMPVLRDDVAVKWFRIKGGVYSYIEKILCYNSTHLLVKTIAFGDFHFRSFLSALIKKTIKLFNQVILRSDIASQRSSCEFKFRNPISCIAFFGYILKRNISL